MIGGAFFQGGKYIWSDPIPVRKKVSPGRTGRVEVKSGALFNPSIQAYENL